jgi:hypothetical protein
MICRFRFVALGRVGVEEERDDCDGGLDELDESLGSRSVSVKMLWQVEARVRKASNLEKGFSWSEL